MIMDIAPVSLGEMLMEEFLWLMVKPFEVIPRWLNVSQLPPQNP